MIICICVSAHAYTHYNIHMHVCTDICTKGERERENNPASQCERNIVRIHSFNCNHISALRIILPQYHAKNDEP